MNDKHINLFKCAMVVVISSAFGIWVEAAYQINEKFRILWLPTLTIFITLVWAGFITHRLYKISTKDESQSLPAMDYLWAIGFLVISMTMIVAFSDVSQLESLAQLGDFTAGIFGSIIAAIALAALIISTTIQQKELKKITDQYKDDRINNQIERLYKDFNFLKPEYTELKKKIPNSPVDLAILTGQIQNTRILLDDREIEAIQEEYEKADKQGWNYGTALYKDTEAFRGIILRCAAYACNPVSHFAIKGKIKNLSPVSENSYYYTQLSFFIKFHELTNDSKILNHHHEILRALMSCFHDSSTTEKIPSLISDRFSVIKSIFLSLTDRYELYYFCIIYKLSEYGLYKKHEFEYLKILVEDLKLFTRIPTQYYALLFFNINLDDICKDIKEYLNSTPNES